MEYPYHCPKCSLGVLIHRPITESPRDQQCPQCGEVMTRVWTIPRMNFGFRPYVHDQNDQFKFKNL